MPSKRAGCYAARRSPVAIAGAGRADIIAGVRGAGIDEGIDLKDIGLRRGLEQILAMARRIAEAIDEIA